MVEGKSVKAAKEPRMDAPRRVYAIAASVAVASLGVVGATSVGAADGSRAAHGASQISSTATPIRHLVVIFQENVSFDHYFGTYPKAANSSGQPFQAARDTPKVNNLANTDGVGGQGSLLTNNPNNDAHATQPNPRPLTPPNL